MSFGKFQAIIPQAHASLEISCKFIWIMEYVALAIVIIIVNGELQVLVRQLMVIMSQF